MLISLVIVEGCPGHILVSKRAKELLQMSHMENTEESIMEWPHALRITRQPEAMSKMSSARVAGMVQSDTSAKVHAIEFVKKCMHSWMPEATMQDAGGMLAGTLRRAGIWSLSHWRRVLLPVFFFFGSNSRGRECNRVGQFCHLELGKIT